MSDAVDNAATATSLDAADIVSMAKSLETLTLANATLVRELALLRDELTNRSSQRANSKLYSRFLKTL